MSKKRTPHRKPPEKKSRRRITKTVVIAILICAAASGAAVSRHEPLRRTLGLSTAITPAQTPPTASGLAKEYIYSGGRLIATEEPTPTSTPPTTPGAPTNLVATAASANSIELTWNAPPASAGTVSHYNIERKGRSGITTLTSTLNVSTFTDPTAQPDNVYRYRVQAVFAGVTSNFSNGDLATTFFLSDPVVGNQQTVIRARHFTDLRQAVNDVRLIAGLPTAAWSTPAPVVGGSMMGNHVEELRTNLKPALDKLGLSQPNYYDPTPPSLSGKVVRADHINDLRERMK